MDAAHPASYATCILQSIKVVAIAYTKCVSKAGFALCSCIVERPTYLVDIYEEEGKIAWILRYAIQVALWLTYSLQEGRRPLQQLWRQFYCVIMALWEF